jgi:hypothetical protein
MNMFIYIHMNEATVLDTYMTKGQGVIGRIKIMDWMSDVLCLR